MPEVYVPYRTMRPLWKRRLMALGGLIAFVAWFAFVSVGPNATDGDFSGERILVSAMPDLIAGSWRGYWKSNLDRLNEELSLEILPKGKGKFLATGYALNQNCAGNGNFSAIGQMKADDIQFMLDFVYPGCGDVRVYYVMKRARDGRLLLRGNYFETMKGDTGHHFLVRK
jgi:hypothetical protein